MDGQGEGSAEVASGEEFVPFPVPVLKLLEGFPLIFIVADELRGGHDAIPIIVYVNMCNFDFFQEVENLDGSMITSLMIFTPTFLKVRDVKGWLRV